MRRWRGNHSRVGWLEQRYYDYLFNDMTLYRMWEDAQPRHSGESPCAGMMGNMRNYVLVGLRVAECVCSSCACEWAVLADVVFACATRESVYAPAVGGWAVCFQCFIAPVYRPPQIDCSPSRVGTTDSPLFQHLIGNMR